MMQKFIEAGYEIVDFEAKAEIYVINTCTVTNIADKKSRQMLRRVKQQNKDAILVAVGCYVQVAREKLEEIEDIDLILGTKEKKDIVEYVERYLVEKEKIISVSVSDPSHTLVAAYKRISLIGKGKDQVRLLLSRSLVSVDHGNAIKQMSGVHHHCRQCRSYERRPCSYEVYHNILQ